MKMEFNGLSDWQIMAFEMECIRRIISGKGCRLDYELFPPYDGHEWYVELLERYEAQFSNRDQKTTI